MFNNNPFAELPALIPPSAMQIFVVVMIILVVAGTLFDVIHKKSAKYFFESWRDSKNKGDRKIGGREMASLAVKTTCVEVLTSGEFCDTRRRVAHLLTMYGFIAFVITSAILIFKYSTPSAIAPAIIPQLWHIGALMICVGGYWFWFFIRVDVTAEGNSPFRIIRADLFILSLLGCVTFGLIWSILQSVGAPGWANLFFGLFVLATILLFAGIPWSKFAHMFFKPAAAFQKRVSEADGSRRNLPPPADKPKVFGSARRLPQSY